MNADVTAAPTTIDELWEACFVANNAEEAVRQAERQFAPFHHQVIELSSFTGQMDGRGWCEFDLTEPASFQVIGLRDDTEWDNGEMIPEWDLSPVDPDQVVTDDTGATVRLGDIEWPAYFAPGIGTEAGFAGQRPMIQPEPEKDDV